MLNVGLVAMVKIQKWKLIQQNLLYSYAFQFGADDAKVNKVGFLTSDEQRS